MLTEARNFLRDGVVDMVLSDQLWSDLRKCSRIILHKSYKKIIGRVHSCVYEDSCVDRVKRERGRCSCPRRTGGKLDEQTVVRYFSGSPYRNRSLPSTGFVRGRAERGRIIHNRKVGRSTVMKRAFTWVIGCFFLILSGCVSQEHTEESSSNNPLFHLIDPESTNVHFENRLSESPRPHMNELSYEYFTNGGGVAVGDVNRDGLDDLYFTANMGYNKLYLNRGGMKFEDVTDASGVAGRRNTWNTGVTMVDVNGDGLLDIYVCYSGDLPLDRRIDELYINQGANEEGVPTFEEQAEQYGLAHPHSSNQAYFFDYDLDGDLDLYLQTHNVKALQREDDVNLQKSVTQRDTVNGNRFYVNDGDHFVDVTDEVGISSSPMTYGLGAGVSDLNRNGRPDIYVANDYSPPDYLYINDGSGGFQNRIESSIGQISLSSMGVDVADINNDGLVDIMVADMLPEDNLRQKLLYVPSDRNDFKRLIEGGGHYQYTRNTLQLNNGDGTFSEIGRIAGIAQTDWSWAALAADYDNDGWKDLYVTNGIMHDITNQDFLVMKLRYMEERNYDLDLKDIGYLMGEMPSNDLKNHVFKNKGTSTFEDISNEWGLDVEHNSNGAAYTDLDNDGDLDIVTNNINDKASIYENKLSENNYLKIRLNGSGRNKYGIGSKIDLYTAEGRQFVEQFPMRGYLSSVSPTLHVGLGQQERVDSLHVTWPDGQKQTLANVAANQTLTLHQEDASGADRTATPGSTLFAEIDAPLDFEHRLQGDVDDFSRNPMLVTSQSFSGPALARSDIDGDGRADVFVGGGTGQSSTFYLQQPDGRFVAHPQPAFERDRASNDVDARFLDVNHDGHPDLYVASGGYDRFASDDPALQDRLYINDGDGNFTRSTAALPRMPTSTGAVATADLNGDDILDLFVGGRVVPGRYPSSPRSYVLVNDGEGRFEDRTDEIAPELSNIGMVSDAAWHDLNEDGTEDLIVVGEWMPVTVFLNDNGTLSDQTDRYFERAYSGLWNTVHVDDVNRDGRPDLLVGNLGLNALLKASRSEPAEIFYDDFNQNGSVDHILSVYIQGERYPFSTLNRMREQIFSIGSRFGSYEEYARAMLEDVLTEEERKAARKLRADFLETSLFVMTEDGTFQRGNLPIEAQFAPVFSIASIDYNDDGIKDLIVVGNDNEARIRFGKYDANYGMLFRGDGNGAFTYIPQYESGLRLRGDIRDIMQLDDMLFFGTNRGPLQTYRRQRD